MKRLCILLAVSCVVLGLAGLQTIFAADLATHEEGQLSPVTQDVLRNAAKHNEQGIESFKKQNYGVALLEFNRALSEDPQSIRILINRGLAFAKRGQYNEVLEKVLLCR